MVESSSNSQHNPNTGDAQRTNGFQQGNTFGSQGMSSQSQINQQANSYVNSQINSQANPQVNPQVNAQVHSLAQEPFQAQNSDSLDLENAIQNALSSFDEETNPNNQAFKYSFDDKDAAQIKYFNSQSEADSSLKDAENQEEAEFEEIKDDGTTHESQASYQLFFQKVKLKYLDWRIKKDKEEQSDIQKKIHEHEKKCANLSSEEREKHQEAHDMAERTLALATEIKQQKTWQNFLKKISRKVMKWLPSIVIGALLILLALIVLLIVFALIYNLLSNFQETTTKVSGIKYKTVTMKWDFKVIDGLDFSGRSKPYDQEVYVDKNTTVFDLLTSQGIKEKDIEEVQAYLELNQNLNKIEPNTIVSLDKNAKGYLFGITYFVNFNDELQLVNLIKDSKGQWVKNDSKSEIRSVEHVKKVVLDSSFAGDMSRAGVSVSLRETLRHIFKKKIDLDNLKAGDTIVLMYQTSDYRGLEMGLGPVNAVEIITKSPLKVNPLLEDSMDTDTNTTQSDSLITTKPKLVQDGKMHVLKAYYYERSGNKSSNYYDEQGLSWVKAFRNKPLDVLKMTSPFGFRFHPILKRWRLHTGVDYGAPQGTPIHAVDDGVIESVGYKGGYGNLVIMRHDNTTETYYAHMSRFANIRPGDYVPASSVIGYVGRTGYATGPHLHFEVRINGIPVDPQITMAGFSYVGKTESDRFAKEIVNYEGILNFLLSVPTDVNDSTF